MWERGRRHHTCLINVFRLSAKSEDSGENQGHWLCSNTKEKCVWDVNCIRGNRIEIREIAQKTASLNWQKRHVLLVSL